MDLLVNGTCIPCKQDYTYFSGSLQCIRCGPTPDKCNTCGWVPREDEEDPDFAEFVKDKGLFVDRQGVCQQVNCTSCKFG